MRLLEARDLSLYDSLLERSPAGRRERLTLYRLGKVYWVSLDGLHSCRKGAGADEARNCKACIIEMKRILATEGSVHRTSRAECRNRKTSISSSYSAVHLHPCILDFPAYTAIRVHLTVYTAMSFHWQFQEEHYPSNQRRCRSSCSVEPWL